MNKIQNKIIDIENVSKTFGNNKVLSNTTLQIFEGESLVIVGRSGVGKSVLLKCLLKLIIPDSGVIRIFGKDIHNLNDAGDKNIYNKIGMLFQGGALFDSLTVWENISFSLINNKKMKLNEAKEIAVKKLNEVGLKTEVAEKYPAELSGGMKKRVALARAVAVNPEIIFFDEPTTGLDPIMSDVINNLIKKNVKELGATAVTITHDISSVRKIADRVAMLHEGKIIWQGSVKEMDKTSNEFVNQFINGHSDGPIYAL
jgi:phospholipid/cholesterol/gamma-HCH transport system ATP-binding protein